MAYDVARERVVMISANDTFQSRTLEWDGAAIVRPAGSSPPGYRTGAIVYDIARARSVRFGGFGLASGLLNGTWEWDGITWTDRSPAGSPSGRYDHSMAYDAARRRTVLFGGHPNNTGNPLGDTWEWDGIAWTRHVPATSPSARLGHSMVYDAARQRVVLFGGLTGLAGTAQADTWEWDGSTWVQRFPQMSPPARYFHGMAYDAHRQLTVLVGGAAGPINVRHNDAWAWDGTNWHMLPAPTAVGDLVTYDVRRQTFVMFAGDAVWEGDGSNWNRRVDWSQHPEGAYLVMAGNLFRPGIVAFGSVLQGTSRTPVTWQWTGYDWSRHAPPASPGAREDHAMAQEGVNVLLFGGAVASGVLEDTWRWDGVTWTSLVLSARPPARRGHALASDLARGRVVLFGGEDASGPLADTWEWHGSGWVQAAPAASPSARSGHAMAFDLARQRTVLFGGRDAASSNLADTWEWDGVVWTKHAPSASPPAGSGHAMAYDPLRKRTVLHAGTGTWEWDGNTWIQTVTTAWQLGGRAAAFDPISGCVIRAGFTNVTGRGALTWRYTMTPAAQTALGAGCGGAAGVPWFTTSLPALGSSMALDLGSVRALSPCLFALSASSQSLSLGGGCTLYVSAPIVDVASTSNAFGFATARIAIPGDASLRAAVVYAQAVIADPLGPVSGLTLSAALRITVGD